MIYKSISGVYYLLMDGLVNTISSFLYYGISFMIIISVIVFVHEYGHYIAARLCKVRVETFSIGFGKELFGFYDKYRTRWKFSIIPAGGYVKMFGDLNEASSPDEEKIADISDEEKKHAFHFKKIYQKAFIVAAGPIANFILSIVILSFLYVSYGKPNTTTVISEIAEDGSAYESGLQIGDKIVSIDGDKVFTFDDIIRSVSTSAHDKIDIIYERNGEINSLILTPKTTDSQDVFGNPIRSRKIGISSNLSHYEKLSIPASLFTAVLEIKNIIASTCKVLSQMISGKRDLDDLGGPIRIIKYSGQSVDKGFIFTIWFIAMLSVNIGFVNLLPIPVLDGGHLLFYLIEACIGTSPAMKLQKYAMKAGMIILLMLLAFTTFNDIKMLF